MALELTSSIARLGGSHDRIKAADTFGILDRTMMKLRRVLIPYVDHLVARDLEML